MLIRICYLYYDLMNTYGDYGNLLTFVYRCHARGIKTRIINFSLDSKSELLEQADFFLMGGAEDRQQKLVANNLIGLKKKILERKIKEQVPGLFICGAYQFLGEYYRLVDQKKIICLNFAPLYTQAANNSQSRLMGDIVTKTTHPDLLNHRFFSKSDDQILFGFENHLGRTYLHQKDLALGQTIVGYGNNDQDNTEGLVMNNIIGTYLHGPILARNPQLADYLIEKVLQIKYNQAIVLKPLDNKLENENRQWLLKKLHVKI